MTWWCLDHKRWWVGCKKRVKSPGDCVVVDASAYWPKGPTEEDIERMKEESK